jgi:hypothetical protein
MPKRIAYSGIHRIEAVCRGDGDSGDDVHMLIRSSSGNALVTWHMRGGLTLFDKLAALPGFDHDKWSRAGAYAPAGKDLIFGKKFVVYERSI